MAGKIEIVPEVPFNDGEEAGKALGRKELRRRTGELQKDKHLKPTLGAMSRTALAKYVDAKLHTPPDFVRYPELEDLYPERVDSLRGLAQGAECSLEEAAVYDYLAYRQQTEQWYQVYQLQREPGHCSGILLVGPDGVIGGQSVESGPPQRKPKSYRWRAPKPYAGLKQKRTEYPDLVLRRPRTGYIESWGVTNEKGVGCCAGNSCGTWLDEPIEDTWPIGSVPLLRFAHSIDHLAELFRRYTLHNWGRGSSVWADTHGNGMIVEKSYRRIGIRMLTGSVLWSTEGHFESPEMNAYIRAKRLEYVEKAGKHLGAGDLQYASDCAVRFTHIGELCHEAWGRGYEHIRRILTDHAPFPRAVCRHGGPDTDEYDRSVTMGSFFVDFTRNRSLGRNWVPWKKFPCQVPEGVAQYPARP